MMIHCRAILAIRQQRPTTPVWGAQVPVTRTSCVRKPFYAGMGQMPVWRRVASPNLIAVLRVWALLTPSRVLPANFSMKASSALTAALAAPR